MTVLKGIEAALRAEKVRPDFVPASDYVSRDFAQLEKARLWPKVWQVACREEEIPKVGDFITYQICDQSLIVVRSAPGEISCFHNVCLHRGRRLTEASGNVARFYCNYHGWQWGLDGKLVKVLDRDDWHGCPSMADGDLRLRNVKVDTWAGFVFINMDPDCEPLAEFLDPVPSVLGPFEYDRMRFRFYATFRLPCNWKVAQEAFDEGYHVAATHPQLLENMGDDYTRSFAHGRHGMFVYPYARAPMGQHSPRLNRPPVTDLREGLVAFFDLLNRQLPIYVSLRDGSAARRLLTEASVDDPPRVLLGKMLQYQREAAIAEGAGWPNLTPEQMGRAGADWHVFPNLVTLPYPDGVIVYRSRPDGDDPDSCLYDVWGLERYAPGAEPTLKRLQFLGKEEWRGVGAASVILEQDFLNMEQVQQGMKSHGFPGNRTSPIQEVAISNMHRVLREEFLFP